MPIFDYHCHLPPRQIAENTRFETITQMWLGGDHYKWRAMRANGVDEHYITGDATDREKFRKWAETVPATIGNPLFHWTHLELRRPFGITDKLLTPETADGIYDQCNQLLQTDAFRARGIMEQMNVKLVCTTDDPTDDLRYHQQIRNDKSFDIKVYPALRPDKAHAIENPEQFNSWVTRLEKAADTTIGNYEQFLEVLDERHQFFHEAGCRLSDHGIERPVAAAFTFNQIKEIFKAVRSGKTPSPEEVEMFRTAMLLEFGRMNAARDWVMQLHMGALRGANTRRSREIGPDSGFDSIADEPIAKPLARYLDTLEKDKQLPKTILYVLNPNHNEVAATMIGNFQDGSVPGKMQFGTAWWFNDQKDGMEQQMKTLANMGLLSRFVGMLTDSRSFLSYPRHEYFRRILCNLIGDWVEAGEVVADMQLLGTMVENICYNNAVEYFGLDV
jgi:glucuronate isomerase